MGRSAATAVVVALLLTGCSGEMSSNRPDLDALYSRSAQSHGPDRNPIIVIPGLTGSKLVENTTGRVVWGAFAGDYAKPAKPEDARLIALPMRQGAALSELRDDVYPAGVLDRLKLKLLGIPIDLRPYFHILGALGAGGYRDESLALSGEVDWGDEHFTCFQFDYDWRRDNVENAQRLHRFIEEKKIYVREEMLRRYGVDQPDLKFDVVTHSMGGLLLRYYLRYGGDDLPPDGALPEVTWAGAANIARAVLVAPPNAGTLESIERLVEGKGYGPFVQYSPALLGTFPSGYQLLPRARHAMVLSAGRPVEDLFDPALWRREQWGLASTDAEEMLSWLLPDEANPAARRRIALDHQRKALERARHFTAALDQPASSVPDGTQLFLIAGDGTLTPRRVEVGAAEGKVTVVDTAPGDGKVLRASALMDERLDGTWSPWMRSPVDWRTVMFLPQGHIELTRGRIFTDNLLFWLLELPSGPGSSSRGSH